MKLGVLILAGGKSSRMGGFDKSQLTYQNQTFLDKLCEELSVYKYKYISDNQIQKHHYDGYMRIQDEYQKIGPISGIVSTFHQTNMDYLFVVGCDMPFMKKDVVLVLKKYIDCYDGVFVYDHNHFYPLGAIYSRAMLPIMEKHIQEKQYSLMKCIEEAHVCQLSLDQLNIDHCVYHNINTIEDYKNIK